MRIVLDTNILLSALIRDSMTRHLIVALNVSFYYPEQSIDEIVRNRAEVIEKAGISEDAFNTTFARLFQYINLVRKEDTGACIKQADSIIGHIHKNDVLFVAAALSKDAFIWSNDTHFQKQHEVKVITTRDVISNWKKLSGTR